VRRLRYLLAVLVALCASLGGFVFDVLPAFGLSGGVGPVGQLLADDLGSAEALGVGALSGAEVAIDPLAVPLLFVPWGSSNSVAIATEQAIDSCASKINANGGYPPWTDPSFGLVGQSSGHGGVQDIELDENPNYLPCDYATVFPLLYPNPSVVAAEPWVGRFCASVQVWDGGGEWWPSVYSSAVVTGTNWAWLNDLVSPSDIGSYPQSVLTAQEVVNYLDVACPSTWLQSVYGSAYGQEQVGNTANATGASSSGGSGPGTDGSGNYAYCNVALEDLGYQSGHNMGEMWASCNTGGALPGQPASVGGHGLMIRDPGSGQYGPDGLYFFDNSTDNYSTSWTAWPSDGTQLPVSGSSVWGGCTGCLWDSVMVGTQQWDMALEYFCGNGPCNPSATDTITGQIYDGTNTDSVKVESVSLGVTYPSLPTDFPANAPAQPITVAPAQTPASVPTSVPAAPAYTVPSGDTQVTVATGAPTQGSQAADTNALEDVFAGVGNTIVNGITAAISVSTRAIGTVGTDIEVLAVTVADGFSQLAGLLQGVLSVNVENWPADLASLGSDVATETSAIVNAVTALPADITSTLTAGLTTLFEPSGSPWTAVDSEVQTKFPVDVGVQVGQVTTGLAGPIGRAATGADSCGPQLDFRPVLSAIPWGVTGGNSSFVVNLPTPAASGCPAMFAPAGKPRTTMETEFGSVFGYRVLLKGFLTVVLALTVLWRFMGSVGPGLTGLETDLGAGEGYGDW
jgi:hypothetical protein